MKGDMDQDRELTLADAVLFLKILTNTDTYGQTVSDFPNSGVDVNGDLKAGLAEAVYILQDVAELR